MGVRLRGTGEIRQKVKTINFTTKDLTIKQVYKMNANVGFCGVYFMFLVRTR